MREGVFRLLTFCFSAACLAAFVWFGLTVELGEHTLFGHMRAIGGTPEAKQLGEGIKTKVDDFVGIEAARRAAAEAARKAVAGDGDGKRDRDRDRAGPPQDEHTAADREALRKVARPAAKAPGAPATNAVKKSVPAGTRAAPARPAAAPRPAASPRQGARPQPAAAVRRVPEAGTPR
jgi:hypothetical protein